jgi:hypothetical protein
VIVIVSLNFTVAIEAQRHRVHNVVVAALCLWNDMVHFDVDAACLLTEAAMPVTPEKDLLPRLVTEAHKIRRWLRRFYPASGKKSTRTEKPFSGVS